jgi:hypothetical protein
MTDYKQLCAELIDALDSGIPSARIRSSPLADQARDALAEPEPEPEPPTDEETIELILQQMHSDLAAAARFMASFDPDNIKASSVFRISKRAVSIKDSLRSLMIEVDDLLAIVIELEPQ